MEILKLEEVQRYYDTETGDKLSLWFGEYDFFVDEISVSVSGVPLLRNEKSGEIHFPDKTKHMIAYFVDEARKNNKPGIVLSPKNLEHKRFSFAEKYDFLYSQIDYEYIPGLIRPWDEGFLTPVFFNISVLNKYSQHPDYKLDLFSETYGNISYRDEWIISFGVNKNNKVIFWLGDIDKLPDNEKYYLRSENVETDHDMQSEFYDAQIDVQFSDPSKQSITFHLRKELNDRVKQKLSFDLYMLEGEVSQVISNLHRPIFWEDKHVGPVIESFNRIFVESINNKSIKDDIKLVNSAADTKNKGSLKIFQLWLEERVGCENAADLMCPFYVLYDFRIITCHLQSSEKRSESLKSINTRLGINESNDDYEVIYDAIISMLSSSYTEILERV
jgi:hypothetical protein